MAMASIKVENGLFVKGKRGITVIDETHAEGNGWVCERMGNKILCRTSKECSDGVHIVKLKIDIVKGTIRLIRKTPNQPKEIFQNIFKNRNLYDGEIVLSKEDVEIDRRYAFYRENTFTDFLKKYDIDRYVYLPEEKLNLLKLPVEKNMVVVNEKTETESRIRVLYTSIKDLEILEAQLKEAESRKV